MYSRVLCLFKKKIKNFNEKFSMQTKKYLNKLNYFFEQKYYFFDQPLPRVYPNYCILTLILSKILCFLMSFISEFEI